MEQAPWQRVAVGGQAHNHGAMKLFLSCHVRSKSATLLALFSKLEVTVKPFLTTAWDNAAVTRPADFHAGYAQEASGMRTAHVTADDSGTIVVNAGQLTLILSVTTLRDIPES